MTDLSSTPRPFGRTAVRSAPVVRLRCTPCDVAWTGAPESGCWVCGGEGVTLNRLLLYTDRGADSLEEFDLLR